MLSGTKKIVYAGLFISINIILARMLAFYPVPTIRISFENIPLMLSGIILGPFMGAVTGGMADIIGTVMFPPPTGATYFPGFTISKILVGLIPALLYRNLKGYNIVKITVSVIVTEIICSLTLDTLWLSIMYNKGMLVLLPTRIIGRLIIMVGEITLIHIIMERVVKRSLLKNA